VLFPSTLQREKKAVRKPNTFIYLAGADWTATRVATGRKIAAVRKGFRWRIHMLARATLEGDGVRFCYEFTNRSSTAYDMIYAVTDPRLGGIFHDERLERTYVHHRDGFDLLASETPSRLTMPIKQWLPSRYLASFTWPVPQQRIEVRDGITHYNKSRAWMNRSLQHFRRR